jgi:hypothetical protein
MAPMLRSAVQQVMRNFITCRIKSAAVAAAGGAAIGGLAGGGIEVIIQMLTGDGKIEWGQVMASALDGAKTGALEGALLAMSPTTFLVYEGVTTMQAAFDLWNVINDPTSSTIEIIAEATTFVMGALPLISPRLAKRLSDALQQFCFPAGTEIAVEGGSKPIESIQVGDMVWAQSDQTGEVTLKRVKQLFVNVAASLVVITAGTNTIEATDEHAFWIADQSWKSAGQIQVGDELWTRSGERIKVAEIAHKKGQFTVYNFEVEEAHTYFAGFQKFLTHNKNCDENLKNFKFGKYLESKIGPAPADMYDPHAHHILFKEGNGEAQKKMVEEGQALLRRYDIDPIMGVENLVWAPNRVAGQHDSKALGHVLDRLKAVEAGGGDREDIVDVLKELGRLAATR